MNSNFTDNLASKGGAIYSEIKVNITGNIFTGNQALSYTDDEGDIKGG